MMPIFNNFFFNHTPATKLSTLSLHDALPILLLMPTLNFLPVWFALSLLRFRLPSKRTKRSEEQFSRNAETDIVCRLLLEKKKKTNRNETLLGNWISRIYRLSLQS